MCVMSKVFDHYRPLIPIAPVFPVISPEAQDHLAKVLDEFRKAQEAARVVDALTDQPDCEDPEKAKLLERIEKLEAELKRLRKRRRNFK